MRTVIIGNSGSGKTWLAKCLAEKTGGLLVHLDDVFWLPGGFDQQRDRADVSLLIDNRCAEPEWVVEGVYADLASRFMPCALNLVWLDLPWVTCKQRLERRGSESKAHMNREQSAQGLLELIVWAEAYWSRQGSSGYSAHLALYEAFLGQRSRICSELDAQHYLSTFLAGD